MKKILLAVFFLGAFSSVAVNAQVFIPQPPVIYNPGLDPVRIYMQQQVFRQMMLGEVLKRGGKTGKTGPQGAPTAAPAAAVDYTVFKPRQENYLPKLLAQAVKGSVAEQRQAEQMFESEIESYKRAAAVDRLPSNDVASAFSYFIYNNYHIYHALVAAVPRDKDPYLKRAKSSYEVLTLLEEKRSRQVTPGQFRMMYLQIKDMLSANAGFKKITDEQKQKITETLAIMMGIAYRGYTKAVNDGDEKSVEQAREAAKQSLEQLLGAPVGKIRISMDGVHVD